MLWIRIAFSALFLSLVALANVFLYRRLVADHTNNRLLRTIAIALLVAPMAGLLLVRFGPDDTPPPRELVLSLMTMLGFSLMTLMPLVVIETARKVRARLQRRKAAKAKANATPPPPAPLSTPAATPTPHLLDRRELIAAGAATIGLGSSVFGMYRAFAAPQVTEIAVKMLGLPKALDGFTIVQLTDIHVGAVIQEKFLDTLVETANGARADLLAITGDLVDGSPDRYGKFVSRLRNLKSKHGTHFVSGNHDYYSGWDEWSRVLRAFDFRVLRNERIQIGDSGASFELIGVDDFGSKNDGVNENRGYDLEAATAGLDPDRPSVILAHQPRGLEEVSAKNIRLQLSGHTHGGQLFPGTVIGNAIWGARNAGLSQQGNTTLYTSRGCGFVAVPMRVDAPPEVVKVVLVAA